VKIVALLSLLASLAACNKGIQNKDAVRQGVLDYLASRPNLSMGGMTVDVAGVTFKDNKAEAQVTFSAKGGPAGAGGMTMRYTLEQKDKKWVVVGKADSGQSPHGAGAAGPGTPAMPPDMANPHSGGAMVDTEKPGGGAPPAGMPAGHPPVEGKAPASGKK
jgi:hypothetical protein